MASSTTGVELFAQRSEMRYMLGLSTIMARKGGRHPIIFMQRVLVRHRADPEFQAKLQVFEHHVS